jgi:translation initiation factor eIF-2B subunit beta
VAIKAFEAEEEMAEPSIWAELAAYPRVVAQLTAFQTALKRRSERGSFRTAKLTAEFFRNLVGTVRWENTAQLIGTVKRIGRLLVETQPRELAIGNITRRVLHIIREECFKAAGDGGVGGGGVGEGGVGGVGAESSSSSSSSSAAATSSSSSSSSAAAAAAASAAAAVGSLGTPELKRSRSVSADVGALLQSPSLQTILEPGPAAHSLALRPIKEIARALLDGINELMEELENLLIPIAEQALEHIHANEVILTYGRSRTVEEFLKEAARKKREFKVIVAETAPLFEGQAMARALSMAGIDTTVITDSAVFAMMARVNKVLIPAHAVLANGGLIVRSGGHMIAVAAAHHAVPMVCLAGLFKLSPQYAHDQDTFNELNSPSQVMRFEEGDSAMTEQVDVVNPGYDYVAPELVDLYVTNIGGHQPSYIYRLLAEQYSPEDHVL